MKLAEGYCKGSSPSSTLSFEGHFPLLTVVIATARTEGKPGKVDRKNQNGSNPPVTTLENCFILVIISNSCCLVQLTLWEHDTCK